MKKIIETTMIALSVLGQTWSYAAEVKDPYLAIDIYRAHELTTGSPEVVVALLSTSVNCRLAALAPSIKRLSPENRDLDACESVEGINERDLNLGTYSASVIHFVAPSVKILPIRIFSPMGHGTIEASMRGIQVAMAEGAKIISFGGGGDVSPQQLQNVCAVIEDARQRGVTIVAPAGNSGSEITSERSTIMSRCKNDALFSVAALNEEIDGLAPYASYSPHFVQLAAPGENVGGYDAAGNLITFRGSTPGLLLTTGVLALRESLYPGETAYFRREAILRSVTPMASLVGKVESSGMLNAYRALGL
jgi:subtilisin family serine protease